jgi:hypothetical protein
MSTVMDSIFLTPNSSISTRTAVNREGDWSTYVEQIASVRGRTELFCNADELVNYKRQCALAYLGRRAQLHGGLCSRTPRVLSSQLIADLGERNRNKRYARYPWLEKLLKLMAEIELIQEQASSANVFSLVQTVEATEESSHRIGLADAVRPTSSYRAAPDTPRFAPGMPQPFGAT